jgi:hypothetical protein
MKEPTTNILVPKLLDKTSLYANNLKTRIKIDGIFNEFDESANVNFKKFIKLSQQRYKSVKSGTHLNNILNNQKQEIKELSDNILTNKFYNNNEIEKESKKLLKKMGIKENQDLFELRKDIISKTNSLTKVEIKNREKLLKNALKKRKRENKVLSYLPKQENKVKNNLSNLQRKMSIKYNGKIININELNDKKQFFDDLMKNDFSRLNKNFKDYITHLKDIKMKEQDEMTKRQSNIEKYSFLNNFSPERIKFLSYREDDLNAKKPKKKDEQKIDIMKLMRYTKRGNKKWFKKGLKNKEFKQIPKFNPKQQQELKPIFKSINTTTNNFHKNKTDLENINLSTGQSNIYNKTDSNFFNNYKNTIKTVRNEADKASHMNQNFDTKMKTMENFFNTKNLPKIEEYDNIINHTHYFAHNKLSNNVTVNSLKKDKFGYDRNSLDNQKEIFESYNTAYLNKKIFWEQEDRKKELIKKNKEAEIEDTKNFLKEIKRIGRKPNFYTDPYSTRDSNINSLIQIFNETLTDEFYSKKKMESKVNEFNSLMEEKEKEKKLHEEYMNKMMIEEEKKMREKDISYQIFSKMKETLRKENEEENKGEDIDFNYKLFLSKGLVSNKIKTDPYLDYKEFFQYEKEKQKRLNMENDINKFV